LQSGIYRDLVEILSPFVEEKGDMPNETLEMISLKGGKRGKISPSLIAFIKKCLEITLNKFPFPADPQNHIKESLRCLKPFFRDKRFLSFFKNLENPDDVVIYTFKRGCLVRKQIPPRATLFLKTGLFYSLKTEPLLDAIFLTASTGLPLVDSVMLHGVGIKRQGKNFLFLGLSGSGKSTIARLSTPEDVISDDGIIVEKDLSGYCLSPAPLDQSTSYNGNKNMKKTLTSGSVLSSGFLLKRDNEVFLEKILPADASSIILKNHIHYFRYFPRESLERAFYLISDLCRHVPFYMLHFRKDTSFWKLIEDEIS
jgi:hypothetical protein